MSFVLLHITWDWRQSNHLLTCVAGKQSHPGYLKLCLPGPVFCENSWEVCHIDCIPVKRQLEKFSCALSTWWYFWRFQGKKTEGQEEARRWSMQSSCGHSTAVGFQLGQGRNVGWFPQHLLASETSSLPAPHAQCCLWGHGRMFAWKTAVVVLQVTAWSAICSCAPQPRCSNQSHGLSKAVAAWRETSFA